MLGEALNSVVEGLAGVHWGVKAGTGSCLDPLCGGGRLEADHSGVTLCGRWLTKEVCEGVG